MRARVCVYVWTLMRARTGRQGEAAGSGQLLLLLLGLFRGEAAQSSRQPVDQVGGEKGAMPWEPAGLALDRVPAGTHAGRSRSAG